MAKRSWIQWPILAATLGALLTPAGHAQQQQEEWAKIKANCFQGPFKQVRGQTYACRFSNVSFGFLPDATDPRFFVRASYPKRSGKVCATIPFPDPTNAMQHVHKFVESEGTNWSGMQAIGSDINVMFFDTKNQKRDGKCFTFIKLGPMAGRAGEGHLFTMIGFFCKAPGQPLDTNAAASMINAVKLNTD
jgi:hypothetical protein